MAVAAFDTFILCLRIIQSTACVVLNVLTIICVAKYNSLWNSAGVLVASLAITDTLHGLIVYTLPVRTLFRSICTSSLIVENVILFVQLMTFILIALERRNTLLSQLNLRPKWLVKNVILSVNGSWVVIATYFVAYAIITPTIPTEGLCTNKDAFSKVFIQINQIYSILVTLTIAASYGCIGKIVYSSSQQASSNTFQTEQQREQRRTGLRITKMMALVVGVFFVLYIPMAISFAFLRESLPFWQHVLHQLCVSLADVNFWINPAIYAWRNKKFRMAFKQLFSGFWRQCMRHNNSVEPVNALPQQVNVQTITVRSSELLPSTSRALEPKRDHIVQLGDLPPVSY